MAYQVQQSRTGQERERSPQAIREKYAYERDRRIRPDGATQYRSALGEYGYYAKDPYTTRVEREPLRDRVDALIIGAGFGGLLAGAGLRDTGLSSIRLMDEAGDVGGTWYWNRYPGIRCDIESYVYMPLLEETGYVPTERYATGEEIRRHAVRIAEHYDLRRDFVGPTRATGLTWDEDASEWQVETDRGDVFRARYVITSSGTLTQPKLPGIPGIERPRTRSCRTGGRRRTRCSAASSPVPSTTPSPRRSGCVGRSWMTPRR